MESKQFYINRSVDLHAKLEAARATIFAIEKEIDENIRLMNIAPEVATAPAEPQVLNASVGKKAAKKA